MYSLVNQAASMPFFALSWALTLFSHDLYEVAVIARLFDFLLAHNPAMISYLVVAVRWVLNFVFENERVLTGFSSTDPPNEEVRSRRLSGRRRQRSRYGSLGSLTTTQYCSITTSRSSSISSFTYSAISKTRRICFRS